MQIQKKNKKQQSKKCSRVFRKETIVHDCFIEEARRVWEVTKAVGLRTKGQDEEAVQVIARNLAEAAEQRKDRGHHQ